MGEIERGILRKEMTHVYHFAASCLVLRCLATRYLWRVRRLNPERTRTAFSGDVNQARILRAALRMRRTAFAGFADGSRC
jgi:hypothetical protein